MASPTPHHLRAQEAHTDPTQTTEPWSPTQRMLHHASTSRHLSLQHPSRGLVSKGNPLRFLGLWTHFS